MSCTMEFTNEDELRMLRTGPTSISKSQRSQSAFLFRRCFGDLGTRQEMENHKSVMAASVPQGVVWDLVLVFNWFIHFLSEPRRWATQWTFR